MSRVPLALDEVALDQVVSCQVGVEIVSVGKWVWCGL